MKQFKCALTIKYEVIAEAENAEAAELQMFEIFGEAAAQGEIPLELFPVPPGAMVIPMLTSVGIAPL